MHVRTSVQITPETIGSTMPDFRAMPVDFKASSYLSVTSSDYEGGAWIAMQVARENFSAELGSAEGFDNWVLAAMRIDPEEAYVKYNTSKKVPTLLQCAAITANSLVQQIWTKFGSTFTVARVRMWRRTSVC